MIYNLEQTLCKILSGDQMYSEIIVKDEKGKLVYIYFDNVSSNFNLKTSIYETEIICKLGGESTFVQVDVPEKGIKQIINARLVDDFNLTLAMDSDSHNTGESVPVKNKSMQ